MSASINPELLAAHTGDTPSPHNPYSPWDIDYIQATNKIHCVPATAPYLYGDYTSKRVFYRKGSRPELEAHVEIALKDARTRADKAEQLMRHVHRVVLHTMFVPKERHELGGTEEHILRRGFGYCNEMARVLCFMAQIAGLPARLLFVRQPYGDRHVMVETHTGDGWGFFDPSFNICLPKERGIASALDIRNSKPLRARLDKLASTNAKYKATLGKDGSLYSGYFHAFALLNYPIRNFPYGVVRPE